MPFATPSCLAPTTAARQSPDNGRDERKRMTDRQSCLNDLLASDLDAIAQYWIESQLQSPAFRSDRMTRSELSEHSRRFLSVLRQSVSSGSLDIHSPAWADARQLLEQL